MRSASGSLARLIALSVAVVCSTQTYASLISVDSPFGAGTVTKDTSTGLEWLDLFLSQRLGYSGTVDELGPGGLFEDYRLATLREVETLFFQSAGISRSDPNSTQTAVIGLIDLLGVTFGDFDADGFVFRTSTGWVEDRGGPLLGFASLQVELIDETVLWTHAFINPDSLDPGSTECCVIGNAFELGAGFLVLSVPAPQTLALVGLGLLGIALRRRD